MLLDCHVHTRPFSSCSGIEPERLAELAQARGLGGVVLTEHHLAWPAEALALLRDLAPEVRFYSGMEVTLAEGYDVVLVGPELPPFVCCPSLDELDRALSGRRASVFAFVAHPFRYDPRLTAELADVLAWVDGVEVVSVNILRRNFTRVEGGYAALNRESYRNAAAGHGRVMLYNSDAHREDAVGAVANLIPGEPPANEAALVRLLKAARPEERQDPALLARLLER